MGFLGLGNYNKEGPGVSKEELAQKKRIVVFFEIYSRKFWNIIKVNLLFLLFSLPIITIGPAMAGMTYVLRNYAREEHAFVFQDFFDAFKSNFKQSFAAGILGMILGGISVYALFFYYYNLSLGGIYYLFFGAALFFCLTIFFAYRYVYLMIVTLDLKLKYIFKNAFIFALVAPKQNFSMLFGYVGIVGIVFGMLSFIDLAYSFLIVILLLLLLVPATLSFISCFCAYPVVKQYCIDPYNERKKQESDHFDDDSNDREKIFEDTTGKKVEEK